MASSPPVRPPGASGPPETPPPASKWPRWRVLMLIGAVILLGVAILEAAADDVPRWLRLGIYFVGYVLLAYGFFSALSARRGGGATPRGRG